MVGQTFVTTQRKRKQFIIIIIIISIIINIIIWPFKKVSQIVEKTKSEKSTQRPVIITIIVEAPRRKSLNGPYITTYI